MDIAPCSKRKNRETDSWGDKRTLEVIWSTPSLCLNPVYKPGSPHPLFIHLHSQVIHYLKSQFPLWLEGFPVERTVHP